MGNESQTGSKLIENLFRFNDAILRYLITKGDQAVTKPSPLAKSSDKHSGSFAKSSRPAATEAKESVTVEDAGVAEVKEEVATVENTGLDDAKDENAVVEEITAADQEEEK